MGCNVGQNFEPCFLSEDASEACEAPQCWIPRQRIKTTGADMHPLVTSVAVTQSHKVQNILLLCKDEIWSEQVLKRLHTMRANTKEGCFGSVPFSFMPAGLRSRHILPNLVCKIVLHA